MKIGILWVLLMSVTVISPHVGVRQQTNTSSEAKSYQTFWQSFRDAVIKANKPAVADMSSFPISMPYGMSTVRNRGQLIRRYRAVFNHEGSAAKCFETATPTVDPEQPKAFTVGCKNAAGHEVVIYSFTLTSKGWRFTGLDNLNE